MLSQLRSMAVSGIDGYEVLVEVDVSNGLPCATIVGLPDKSVNEAKERVKAAVKNSGFKYPGTRVTVNLAPAEVKKEGAAFDLPIAMGIAVANDQVKGITESSLRDFVIVGELSLDGKTRPVNGVLPMAIEVRKLKPPQMIVPRENLYEATLVRGVRVFPVSNLNEALEVVKKPGESQTGSSPGEKGKKSDEAIDFSDVRGHGMAKRALEIAASGHHNILMIGPPGSGKTMLARRISTIMPPLSFEESLEVTRIYSVQGLLCPARPLIIQRPFRSPHHSASYAGLIGGGNYPKPGEISLAHHGVLFLDELPEFKKNVLEMLRQPIEDGRVVISRARSTLSYPASFMLVASMNPCPCGYYTDNVRQCDCSYPSIKRYNARLSGPLLDRIDIHIEVPRLDYNELNDNFSAENSASIRKRVMMARKIQRRRFGEKAAKWNVHMGTPEIKKHCVLDRECSLLLKEAVHKLELSARAYMRILKLSRTIADMDGRRAIISKDIAEAIQYRVMDKVF